MDKIRTKIYKIVRWSERYFRTDMVYIAKGGGWLLFVQAVGVLSAFALSVAFANLFSRHEYGIYKYALSLAGVVGAFSLTGIGTAITQAVANGADRSLKKGFLINLKWSTGIVFISLAVSLYYFLNGNDTLGWSLIIVAIATPLLNSASLYGSFLNGKRDFRRMSLYGTFRVVVPTTLLILSLFVTQNPIAIIAIYFGSNLLVNFLCYVLTVRLYKPDGVDDPSMLSYSKHLSIMSALNIVADNIDRIIVFQYVGGVELAVYSFATSIPLQIKGILKNIFPLALPKFASREISDIRKEMPYKMLRYFLVIIGIVVIYIVSAPWIYGTFFPQYIDAILISQIFSLSLLAYVGTIPMIMLHAKKALPSLYRINFITAIMKIGLLFSGVLLWGFWGLVLARITYEFVGLAVVLIYARRT